MTHGKVILLIIKVIEPQVEVVCGEVKG
jgi:hypothetical protein